MHFSAPKFCVLSHWVAKVVDPRLGRHFADWASIHRTPGSQVLWWSQGWPAKATSGVPPPSPAAAGVGTDYPWV